MFSPIFTCRPATREDSSTITQFQLAMAQETEGLNLDPSLCQAGVEAVFKNASRGQYWVAEVTSPQKQVIACLLTQDEWSDWRNGVVWWIHSVYVLPAFRKKGIFQNLYGHLKTLVESDSKLRGLRLYVDKRNTPAQKIYDRLGMSAEHYSLYEWLK